MPKLRIIVVDRTRSPFLKQGEDFYIKRLRRYTKTEWIEVKPTKIKKKRSTEDIIASEGYSITKKIDTNDYVIALDRLGKTFESEGLASRLEKLFINGKRLNFIIGGPLGISKEVLKNSHERLSLSSLTLTHEMTRLILLEQLYRAFTIIRGEKYHK